MRRIIFLILSCCLPLLYFFYPNIIENKNSQIINYEESEEDFPNPERGFYKGFHTYTSDFHALDLETLKGLRKKEKASDPNGILSTLIFRLYVLDNFTDKVLSESILSKINEDLQIARDAGVKLILRFAYVYKDYQDGLPKPTGNCPERIYCPPYGDAPVEIVLNHVHQLEKILRQNADVIAVVQEGFIGIWGEGYYSDYFGDASGNGDGRLTNEDWTYRNKLLRALLDVVPESRMVQVRTPQTKQRYLFGADAPVNVRPLTDEFAFKKTDEARIAFYDDCFLLDESDAGTYTNYGNDNSSQNQNEQIIKTYREYVEKETQFVVIGGESCGAPDEAKGCGPESLAEQSLSRLHFTYLNASFHPELIKSWYDNGCLERIKQKLGYRFVLKNAILPVKIKPGTDFNISIELENIGYAAPFNDRPIELIFRNVSDLKTIAIPLRTSIRKWYGGSSIVINGNYRIPRDVLSGRYELLLNLPDGSISISKRPEYSIRLANKDVWESSTGFNKLHGFVSVK